MVETKYWDTKERAKVIRVKSIGKNLFSLFFFAYLRALCSGTKCAAQINI